MFSLINTAVSSAMKSSMMQRHGAVIFSSKNKLEATGYNTTQTSYTCCNKKYCVPSSHAEVNVIKRHESIFGQREEPSYKLQG